MLDSTAKTHEHRHDQNRLAVIPTAEKLKADDRFSGRGVRIAFLDSGFYPHPDFVDRVIAFHDVSGEERSMFQITGPVAHHWHGTQTVAACAGKGTLSNGIYRGLACDAGLVLVKVSRGGRVGDREIEAGLQWALDNHERLTIRILNISLGGDCDLPSNESKINSLVEELIARGVVITVAAGNSAETRSRPPASAPSAISVGGYSDKNSVRPNDYTLYHSSYGETADGLVKPDLIAPAMFVAAPILPGTPDYEIAETLSMLSDAPDYSFRSLLEEFWETADLNPDIVNHEDESARRLVEYALHRRKIVSTHYQHVDGTSFAAPITASVVAQMLEANPRLTPAAVRNILVSTASRLSGHPALRQGFGILNAAAAVELAEGETHSLSGANLHPPRVIEKSIVFTFHDDKAATVSLVGDFNGWNRDLTQFEVMQDGVWRASIPCQIPGTYRYKFLIDGKRWAEDLTNGFKQDDGFGGFNSLLVIT